MFEIVRQHLNSNQLLDKLEQCSGLIPIDLDIEQRQLVWRDMGQYHAYEGFFKDTVNSVNSLQPLITQQAHVDYFTTDLSVLNLADVIRDSIYPTGFIFHMGRCGSTLLAKALSRSRSNLVFGEASPHNNIWPYLGGRKLASIEKDPNNLSLYRQLILAMGRRRIHSHKYHYIKFTSYNILTIEFIKAAFPTVPILFIYREPTEVLVSMLKRKPGWIKYKGTDWGDFIAGTSLMKNCDALTYFSKTLQQNMSIALAHESQGTFYLDYKQLTKGNLPAILSIFKVDAPIGKELAQMEYPFTHYSKSDYQNIPFRGDQLNKQWAVTPEILSHSQQLDVMYSQMLHSHQNITSD